LPFVVPDPDPSPGGAIDASFDQITPTPVPDAGVDSDTDAGD
jgi:hypothetical protein